MKKTLVSLKLYIYIALLSGGVFFGSCTGDSRRVFTLTDSRQVRQPFHATLSPDGKWVAFGLADSLWISSTHPKISGNEITRPIAAGLQSQVSFSNPFVAWSPDSRQLLFRAGEGVGVPLVASINNKDEIHPLLPDLLTAELKTFQNWAAGGPSWSFDNNRVAFLAWRANQSSQGLQVYVANSETGQVEKWTTDEQSKFSVAWSPDGRWLAFTAGSFGGKTGRIALLPAEAKLQGDPITLIDGEANLYRDLLWSPDARYLLARTLDSTPILLEVYPDGSFQRVDTSLPPHRYIGWTSDQKALFTTISEGMSTRLSLVDITTGEIKHLTRADNFYRAVGIANTNSINFLVFTAESGSFPRDVWSAIVESKEPYLSARHQITNANIWLGSIALAQAEIYRWQSGKGDTLEAQLFLPPHFRRGFRQKSVPLVVIPYGGYVNEFPKGEYFLTQGIQVLAAKGYAVVLPNTRGISNDSQPDKRYGEPQLADTHLLLDALIQDGLVDPNRVATMGHSHGGAMVYYYLTHSDRFCAGIAVNGAADWVFQAKLRRMSGLPGGMGGMPKELPEKYQEFSPLLNANAVKSPLLAVAGKHDTQILPQNALVMVDTLKALGKQAELLYFEDEGHLIAKPENQELFWQRVLDFLAKAFEVQ